MIYWNDATEEQRPQANYLCISFQVTQPTWTDRWTKHTDGLTDEQISFTVTRSRTSFLVTHVLKQRENAMKSWKLLTGLTQARACRGYVN